MTVKRPSASALAAAACLLIAVGLGRGIYQHTAVDRRTHVPGPIDDRYRELLAALPAERDFVYLTDAPWSAQQQQAIYALAPHRLVDSGTGARQASPI